MTTPWAEVAWSSYLQPWGALWTRWPLISFRSQWALQGGTQSSCQPQHTTGRPQLPPQHHCGMTSNQRFHQNIPRAFTLTLLQCPRSMAHCRHQCQLCNNSPGSQRDLVCPAERSRDVCMSKPLISKKLGALLALPGAAGDRGALTSGPGKATKDLC